MALGSLRCIVGMVSTFPSVYGFSTGDKGCGRRYSVLGRGLSSAGGGVTRLDVRAGSCFAGVTGFSRVVMLLQSSKVNGISLHSTTLSGVVVGWPV